MGMVTAEQFEKAKQFVYRYGDLLTRKRFAYHFQQGDKQPVLDVLACYQNDDGGFGNGLELDMMCPTSSGICAETALGYLLELGVNDGPVLERAIEWVLSNRTDNGDLPHPVEAVKAYPHGPWWGKDDNTRIMSVAGLLGKMGRSHPDISSRAAAVFEETYIPFPEEVAIYSYPAALYLRYADGANGYSQYLERLEAAVPGMLKEYAWHHPLFFCSNRWDSESTPGSLWRSEAERAVATLQDDGGVFMQRYARLPWWRPVWTLDMLVILKDQSLLGEMG
jgi:hypothetical protein